MCCSSHPNSGRWAFLSGWMRGSFSRRQRLGFRIDRAYALRADAHRAVEGIRRFHEVRAELRTALDLQKPVIPVLREPCDVPRQLKTIQYVDATSGIDEDAVARQTSEILKAPARGIVAEPPAYFASAGGAEGGAHDTGVLTPWRTTNRCGSLSRTDDVRFASSARGSRVAFRLGRRD